MGNCIVPSRFKSTQTSKSTPQPTAYTPPAKSPGDASFLLSAFNNLETAANDFNTMYANASKEGINFNKKT